ncbi:hypothetical protein POVWA2_039600 [Plasmodium ovale wallikeri]|uniref:Uncharacterized protein n=1 Tax=Plasmodium ovale wallikeri TaxID=864142 RepID=A0A1A8Z8R3_PLAOA|nr:hypothetical protein POVWA1_041030 [Plasmodium ovale wallikeri]SBT40346.1 hypothetical protein POVWA2_039600 [Plasmodium ovale wallikeri]
MTISHALFRPSIHAHVYACKWDKTSEQIGRPQKGQMEKKRKKGENNHLDVLRIPRNSAAKLGKGKRKGKAAPDPCKQ